MVEHKKTRFLTEALAGLTPSAKLLYLVGKVKLARAKVTEGSWDNAQNSFKEAHQVSIILVKDGFLNLEEERRQELAETFWKLKETNPEIHYILPRVISQQNYVTFEDVCLAFNIEDTVPYRGRLSF